jgi:hypothetical protein
MTGQEYLTKITTIGHGIQCARNEFKGDAEWAMRFMVDLHALDWSAVSRRWRAAYRLSESARKCGDVTRMRRWMALSSACYWEGVRRDNLSKLEKVGA